jgi:hypothetical protein
LSCDATTSGSAHSSSAFLQTALPTCLCLRINREGNNAEQWRGSVKPTSW